MKILYPRGAGLDTHEDIIVACVRCVSVPEHREVDSFRSTTKGLLALSDFLVVHGCSHVSMEAVGVYWKPVWDVLRRLLRTRAGHRRTYLERAWPQNRCERRDVDRRPARTWVDPLQLCPSGRYPGVT